MLRRIEYGLNARQFQQFVDDSGVTEVRHDGAEVDRLLGFVLQNLRFGYFLRLGFRGARGGVIGLRPGDPGPG